MAWNNAEAMKYALTSDSDGCFPRIGFVSYHSGSTDIVHVCIQSIAFSVCQTISRLPVSVSPSEL